MIMRFATRQFVLTYKQNKNHASNQTAFYGSLRHVLKSIFGTSYRITKRFCYIHAPIDCCFYALNAALTQEFRKQPELKGMQFRLDLREGLARV